MRLCLWGHKHGSFPQDFSSLIVLICWIYSHLRLFRISYSELWTQPCLLSLIIHGWTFVLSSPLSSVFSCVEVAEAHSHANLCDISAWCHSTAETLWKQKTKSFKFLEMSCVWTYGRRGQQHKVKVTSAKHQEAENINNELLNMAFVHKNNGVIRVRSP